MVDGSASNEGTQPARRPTDFRARALWIDDDKGILRFIDTLLTRRGFLIDGATTGTTGLELGCTKRYDVIGLDLVLPDVSGLHVLRVLRAGRVETPVLVLTGYFSDDALISNAWRAGATDCRAKPIRARTLLEVLDGMVAARARCHSGGCPTASLLAWLDATHFTRAEQAPGLGQRELVEQLQARLLTVLIEPAITIPGLYACARAFKRTLATDAPWGTLLGDVRTLLQRAAPRSQAHPQVARAVARLEELRAATAHLSEANLAKDVGLAPSHLGRRLYQHTGLGFRAWRRLARLRIVVRELAASPERVKQVAAATHWSSHSQLDRHFHDLFGLSPTAFRHRLVDGARRGVSDRDRAREPL